MRLILIRHGETFYNIEDRFTGQADIPLTPLGERQALASGLHLATEHLDVIVSSDLQRAYATATAIANHHRLYVEKDPDLRELSLGMWEGMTSAEVQAREPDLLKLRQADPSTYAPAGGETLVQLRTRAVRALEHWYTRYPDGTVVWVAHSGFIGVLICHLLDMDLNRRKLFQYDNASLSEVFFSRERIRLVHLNETAFLSTHKEEEALRS